MKDMKKYVRNGEDIMELELDVEDLLNKRKLESDRIEFKTGWNPDDIYHSVCAFANHREYQQKWMENGFL